MKVNIAEGIDFCYTIITMFKAIRVLIGTALGLGIANYFHFLGVQGINYLWAALIVMAAVFVLRGFSL